MRDDLSADARPRLQTKTQLDIVKDFGLQLLAGGGAGAIARTVVAPLERVKILQQTGGASAANIGSTLKTITTEQGFIALWRGNGVNVARIIPNLAIKFTCYDAFQTFMFPKGDTAYDTYGRFVRKLSAGSLAAATTITTIYPMDLARVRLMADSKVDMTYKGLFDCWTKTAAAEGGVRALYKGLGVALIGIVPYSAIAFSSYDLFKQQLSVDPLVQRQWWFPWAKLAAGACAGLVAQTLTFPLDTIRYVTVCHTFHSVL